MVTHRQGSAVHAIQKIIESLLLKGLQHSLKTVIFQVNTSNEEQKGGFRSEEDLISAVNHLINDCKYCKFEGLMTIGSAENSKTAAETGDPNPDFTRLCELKKIVADKCSGTG